jgi:hypothetical protein
MSALVPASVLLRRGNRTILFVPTTVTPVSNRAADQAKIAGDGALAADWGSLRYCGRRQVMAEGFSSPCNGHCHSTVTSTSVGLSAARARCSTLFGIGLPTLVAAHVPDSVDVCFQSENGIIDIGMQPLPEKEFAWNGLRDAGGRPIGVISEPARSDRLSRSVLSGLVISTLPSAADCRSMRPAIWPTGWFPEKLFPAWAGQWISLGVRSA